MTDGGRVSMPQHEVWMTCDEKADMFGLLHATVARIEDDVDFRAS